jgi:hypothetical protein
MRHKTCLSSCRLCVERDWAAGLAGQRLERVQFTHFAGILTEDEVAFVTTRERPLRRWPPKNE